jgi:hypothetical protein
MISESKRVWGGILAFHSHRTWCKCSLAVPSFLAILMGSLVPNLSCFAKANQVLGNPGLLLTAPKLKAHWTVPFFVAVLMGSLVPNLNWEVPT